MAASNENLNQGIGFIIYIEHFAGDSFNLELDNLCPADTIGDIKNELAKHELVPAELIGLRLFISGRLLRNAEATLAASGIKSGDVLELAVREPGVEDKDIHKVSVRDACTGRSFQVYLGARSHTSVQTFKQMIQRRETDHFITMEMTHEGHWTEPVVRGTDPANQHLYHNGQALSGNRKLSEFGIKNGSVVHFLKETSLLVRNTGPCVIPEPEHRGITVRQLKDVAVQILLLCEKKGWTSVDPNNHHSALRPEQVTLYDLVHHYISPLTKKHDCSYVELVAKGQQTPVWYVSHWWGESALDFIACIATHAFDRGISEDSSYWICAYALNQHKLGLELGKHPTEAPFCKAMKLTRGVVSVLDHACECYTRIWCCFEISIAIKDLQQTLREESKRSNSSEYLLDIYTMVPKEGAIGLTDGGVVPADKFQLSENGSLDLTRPRSNCHSAQNTRQNHFPQEQCVQAMNIRLEKASASIELDKRRILNLICGRGQSIGKEPPASHENYQHLNALLWGRFAASMYRRALKNGEQMATYNDKLVSAPLYRLYFNLGFSPRLHDAAGLSGFMNALPPTLEVLQIDTQLPLELVDVIAGGIQRLQNLQHLTLGFGHSQTGVVSDILFHTIGELKWLDFLSLDFEHCDQITAIIGIEKIIGEHVNGALQCFELDLGSSCQGRLEKTPKSRKVLSSATLTLRDSRVLSSGDKGWVSKALFLVRYPDLKHLRLEFCDSDSDPALNRVGRGGWNLDELEIQEG